MGQQQTAPGAITGQELIERLEFLITCPWSDYHPGAIMIEAVSKGNRRYLHHPFLEAYRLDRASLGHEIAERIYEDQTVERAPGRYKGPRFDFGRPWIIHLVQLVGKGSRPPGAKISYEKHDIGEVMMPGGLSQQAICDEIALLFDRGEPLLPHLAFLPPEQWESGTGAPVYTKRGSPFYHIVQLTCNARTLSGALVFVSSLSGDSWPEWFLTLHQGRNASGQLVQYLRRFRFMSTRTRAYILDEGVQSLSEPIELRESKKGELPRYWISSYAPPLSIGGDRESSRQDRDLSLCRETMQLIQDAMRSESTTEYASLYCSACQREFHVGEPHRELEKASARGEVISVCEHCWYCRRCHRFSTPTERDAQFTKGDPCKHDRPAGEELRMISFLAETPSSHSGQSALPGRGEDLAGTVYLPQIQQGPASVKPVPASSRTNSKGSHLHPGESVSSLFQAENTVLVVVDTDSSFDLPDGPLFLPAGTRIIGDWAAKQPDDSSVCAVTVGEITWHFPIERITISLLPEELLPWQEQERIASASLALAQEQEQEEHDTEAARLYAQAIAELEASGKTPLELSDARHKRALLLEKVGDARGALLEFERFAHAYEADAFTTGYLGVDRNAVELAVWGYISMGMIILHDTDYQEATLRQQLGSVVYHLRTLLKYIARRYDTKVEALLTAAEIERVLGNKSEARTIFEQAVELYYRQQLGSPSGTDGISLHLKRLQETFGAAKRKPGPRRTLRKKRTPGKRGTRR